MTTFDDREQAFEKKFALDQDLKFRAEARRNKLLAEWAAAKLGIRGAALQDYVSAVVKADLEEKGDEDVFRKIRKDFDAAGVKVPDAEIRAVMGEFLAKAVSDIEAGQESPEPLRPRGRLQERAEAQHAVGPGPVPGRSAMWPRRPDLDEVRAPGGGEACARARRGR